MNGEKLDRINEMIRRHEQIILDSTWKLNALEEIKKLYTEWEKHYETTSPDNPCGHSSDSPFAQLCLECLGIQGVHGREVESLDGEENPEAGLVRSCGGEHR